jgi:hypothetical protein
MAPYTFSNTIIPLFKNEEYPIDMTCTITEELTSQHGGYFT